MIKNIGLIAIVLLCTSAIPKKNTNQTVANQFRSDFPEAKKIKYYEPVEEVLLLKTNTTDTYRQKAVKIDFTAQTEFGKTISHVWYTPEGELIQSCTSISMEGIPANLRDSIAENTKEELAKGWKVESCFKHDVKGEDSWYSQTLSLRTRTFVEYKLVRINSKGLITQENWALNPAHLFN